MSKTITICFEIEVGDEIFAEANETCHLETDMAGFSRGHKGEWQEYVHDSLALVTITKNASSKLAWRI